MRHLLSIAALALCFGGCSDSRRPVVDAHVRESVPDNLAVGEIDEHYLFTDTADGHARAEVVVHYRTVLPAVAELDAMTLPRGAGVRRRMNELRSWALTTVPKEDDVQAQILTAAEQAHAPFPVKRLLVPAGSSVDGIVELDLEKSGAEWKVTGTKNSAVVRGAPDRWPDVPFEDSEETAAHFSELELLASATEGIRRDFLARREKLAAESRAALTGSLVTGRTFEGKVERPDGSTIPARLVVSRGLESGDSVIASLVSEDDAEASAQFTGKLIQQRDGAYAWEARRSRILSGVGRFPNLREGDSAVLGWSGDGLEGLVTAEGGDSYQVSLIQKDKVDVLPEMPAANPSRTVD